jgi:membrane protease YdiL (CAAX protease family)
VPRLTSFTRALVIASGIPLVVLAANVALETLALGSANALAIDALASAASLALFAVAATALGREPIATRLGLGAGRLSYPRIAIGALGVIALSHAAEGLLQWCGATSPGLARFDEALTGLPLSRIGLPFVALVISSACGEELFFRGLLQRGLAPVLGRGLAIAVAAAAFGAAHGDLAHAAAAALLGLYLGLLADAADSIRAAILAHAANNALALLEVTTELRIPEGPAATPLAIVAGLTLACVALGSVLQSIRIDPVLQSPPGAAD